ncbi:tyrosine-type recombinase/integrase [Salibacterium qingdaonense]|uniref:Integrase/recombinase XerD n=1 Tax=Salibacterium qingdaonense TaxID=266892 RepID=A0A1I4Q0X4_9BACI|nr:tyrosine-type recombinase/integrase [Salibacterium qingdaonense]SFM33728.1 integrase/recombinase XerD [Salibacterium qingdaonense]
MQTNEEAIAYFLADNAERFSQETKRSYHLSLHQFSAFSGRSFSEVKPLHIRAWLADLTERGLKQRSIHLKLASVKSFYRYALEEAWVVKDPTVHVPSPQIEDSLPHYLEKRELAALMEWTKGHPRERAVIEMLYTTGVRISELLNIHLRDIKWDARQVWIRPSKGNKERFVLFTTECAERLKHHLATRHTASPYLFENPKGEALSHVYVEQRFRDYSEALGFKVTPHTLRHTFAAHLAVKDMPQSYIQELLGHVNINSTRVYTRLRETERKKQYDQYQR